VSPFTTTVSGEGSARRQPEVALIGVLIELLPSTEALDPDLYSRHSLRHARRPGPGGGGAGADVRTAHGVYEVRDHRRRRPAELAGAASAGEPDRRAMAMIPGKRGLNPEWPH
jgi:hypothetical protein